LQRPATATHASNGGIRHEADAAAAAHRGWDNMGGPAGDETGAYLSPNSITQPFTLRRRIDRTGVSRYD